MFWISIWSIEMGIDRWQTTKFRERLGAITTELLPITLNQGKTKVPIKVMIEELFCKGKTWISKNIV